MPIDTSSDPSEFEQFTAWLDSLTPVPNWVNWGLVFLAVTSALGVPAIMYVWRRWGDNWWSKRSRDAAERRSIKLALEILRVHALSKDRPAMIACGIIALRHLIISLFCWVMLGLVVIYDYVFRNHVILRGLEADFADQNSWLYVLIIALGLFLSAGTLYLYNHFYSRDIEPLRDIEDYTQISRARMKSLFRRAGVTDATVAKRLGKLDADIEGIRRRESK